jgi:hypothetical protein
MYEFIIIKLKSLIIDRIVQKKELHGGYSSDPSGRGASPSLLYIFVLFFILPEGRNGREK